MEPWRPRNTALLVLLGCLMGSILFNITWLQRREVIEPVTSEVKTSKDAWLREVEDEMASWKRARKRNARTTPTVSPTRQQPISLLPSPPLPHPVPPHSFSVFTSTLHILDKEMFCIKSWILDGEATRAYVFVDNVTYTIESLTQLNITHRVPAIVFERLVILQNPEPKSPVGKVLISLMMAEVNRLAPTPWLVLVNSDIILSKRFSYIPALIPSTYAATGMRLDCHLSHDSPAPHEIITYRDIEKYSSHNCWLYSPNAVDYFLYPKDFWDIRAKANGLENATELTSFYLGAPYWDNTFLHYSHTVLVDVSPFFLAGHLHVSSRSFSHVKSSGYSLKPAETSGINDADPDIVHGRNRNVSDTRRNGHLQCHLIRKSTQSRRCVVRGALRYAAFQLCSDGSVQSTNVSMARTYYGFGIYEFRNAILGVNGGVKLNRSSDYLDSGQLARNLGCSDKASVFDLRYV